MSERLHKFLAVTLNPISIFLVSDDRDANDCPIVECLAARRMGRTPPRFRLHNGRLVGVTKQGIILYRDPVSHDPALGPQMPTPIDQAPKEFHGDRTNWVVCLLAESELSMAHTCLHACDLECLDERWESPTKRVLELIGDRHPTFILSKFPVYAFEYKNKSD